ncbi:MAG: acetolactate decarboxylase, partial [Vampirovibrionia bacterium]
MKRLILLIFCLLFFSTSVQAKDSKDVLYQVSTIDALLEGIYDSNYSFKELKKHGNFGIGTVNNLDGELVGINGEFYQVKTDGVAYKVTDKQKTPFAVVTNFKKDKEINIKGKMNYAELTTYLNDKLPTSNIFYAIKIHGTFKTMKTRSVPKQEKPYPPLVEVVKDQSIFNLQNVTGTIIGFKCPSYEKG